jgi:hypothetical protein
MYFGETSLTQLFYYLVMILKVDLNGVSCYFLPLFYPEGGSFEIEQRSFCPV